MSALLNFIFESYFLTYVAQFPELDPDRMSAEP